jgi:FAD/FMN-containing dehydrogenase
MQVITSVTYETHPSPSHIQVGVMQFNTTDESTFRTVLYSALQNLPRVTDAGYTGYGIMGGGSFAAIFLQPNATEAGFSETFAPFYELATHPNVSAQVASFPMPTWIDYCNAFLGDPNIATNLIDSSRLLTANVLMNRTNDLIDLILEFDDFSAGFNFSMLHLQSVALRTRSY